MVCGFGKQSSFGHSMHHASLLSVDPTRPINTGYVHEQIEPGRRYLFGYVVLGPWAAYDGQTVSSVEPSCVEYAGGSTSSLK